MAVFRITEITAIKTCDSRLGGAGIKIESLRRQCWKVPRDWGLLKICELAFDNACNPEHAFPAYCIQARLVSAVGEYTAKASAMKS